MTSEHSKKLEVYFKGMANHYRLDILWLLDKHKKLTLEDITDLTRGNIKTISSHTNKLVQTKLINKTYRGRQVIHQLSPVGQKLVKLTQKFTATIQPEK